MCFSAPVSFVTSAVLTAAGTASVPFASSRPRKFIAAVPFLFAVQQFIEGTQWLVDKPSGASDLLTYAFLVFAFLLWPVYIPLAVLLNEPKAARKKILRFWVLAGFVLVCILAWLIVTEPIHAVVHGESLRYDLNTPLNPLWTTWYVLVVLGAFFTSSDRLIHLFGILTAASVAVAFVFYTWVFTSVWCFFAAALSVLMYVYLRLTVNVARKGKRRTRS